MAYRFVLQFLSVTNKKLILHGPSISVFLPTVKPLYSEQSRDPKKCSLYRGVHPRGVRYVHAHMCLKYNNTHIKTVSHSRFLFRMLLTAPTLPFESLISLNFSSKFKFFRFADMLTKTDYNNMCTQSLQFAN